MIGVDTNILARTILNDDPTWSPISIDFMLRRLTTEEPGYVNLLVLAELVWTLRRVGRFGREQLVEVIAGLLAAENLVVERADLVGRALTAYRAGGSGFADCLIAELNAAAGASHTVTIDTVAAKHPPFQPLA